MSDWKKLFRENMAADPELAFSIKGLEPRTPVQPTVKLAEEFHPSRRAR